MLWDPARNEARPMRGKEEVHDYRYFPEPDIPTLDLGANAGSRAAERLPELPWEKVQRFAVQYGLPAYDAEVLSATRELADYFETVAQNVSDPKLASNWVMVEVFAVANELGVSVAKLGLEAERLAELIGLVSVGTLSHGLGRQVLRGMVGSGRSADEVMEKEGLRKVSDSAQLEEWVAGALAENPREVERYRGGEEKLLAFFIGQVMRKSQGKADPDRLREVLKEALDPRD